MSLRVIAVQKWQAPSHNIYEPVVSCIYKDKELYIYDTEGQLYVQKEYIFDFEHLRQLVNKGSFQWTDFSIDKNQRITVDFYDNIVIDSKCINPFQALENSEMKISRISIKLYYEFLKVLNKTNPVILAELDQDYLNLEFPRYISSIVEESELTDLTDDDKYLAVRIRVEGYVFIVNQVKRLLKSDSPYKEDEIHHLFSRIFILEKQGYIRLDKQQR